MPTTIRNRFRFDQPRKLKQRRRQLHRRRLLLEQLEHRIVLATGVGGGLDTTFDGEGKVITDINGSNPDNTGNQSNQGNAVSIQPDGKILVAGCSECHNQVLPFGKFAVTRYLSNGSLDTSFGANGHAIVDVFPNREAVNDMVLQSDGKIVLVGGESDFGVVRLNSDGSLDTDFGSGGIVITDLMPGSIDIPRGVALDSSGRIVVAGESRSGLSANPDFAIARYDANGALDPTFDTDGLVFTNFALGDGSIPEERGKDVAIDPNGKIVVVGNVRNPTTFAGDDFGIARYNDNGSLDTSFDGDGLQTVGLAQNEAVSSVVIQTDGKIVVGGGVGNGSNRDFALVRLTSGGALDTSFDTDGKVTTDFGSVDIIDGLALQGDGKIVAVGVTRVVSPASAQFAVARYNTDGSLDDDFDTDGKVATNFGSLFYGGQDVAIQADGKIVVAGITDQTALGLDVAVARYEGGGAPPVAEAGGSYNVSEGSIVMLSGSATDDVPATLVYEWDLDGDNIFGESGAEALRGDEDAQNPIFSAVGWDGPANVTIQLRVTNECNLSHTDSATVNILNADPIANDDSAMTNEDQTVTIDVLANDSDAAGALDPLEIVSATDGSKGTTEIDDKGTVDTTDDEIIYTPDLGETGLDTFTYTISDGDGGADTATVTVSIKNLVDIAGRVYDDLDNDGAFEPSEGESGIGGVTVQVWDQAMTTLFAATITAADGTYFLDVNLGAGTYKIVEVVDELAELGLLDGRESAGNLGGLVDNLQDSNAIANINVGAPGTTVDAVDYLFAEIRTSDITGLVWVDFNNDGLIAFGELSVEDAEVTLAGTDDRGNAVTAVVETDTDGVYGFFNLRPGVYTLTETQPPGLDDGIDSRGTVNGVLTGDDSVDDEFSGVDLPGPDSSGEDYNFGERPTADGVVNGSSQTATIVFWKTKHGRVLIDSLNGGSSAAQLSGWLAATFPNMYGASAGANDLTGKTNSQVADFYKDLFKRNKKSAAGGGPPKMDAQVLATALAVFVSSETLAGTVAEDFGFDVTTNGVGVRAFNVGDRGEAFGVANGSDVNVIDLLLAVNARTTNGLLYDLNGDGDTEDMDETLFRTVANDVFSAINKAGNI